MRNIAVTILFILLLAFSCKQKYTLPAKAVQSTGYLVVEGNINVGSDSTIIRLSRATQLTDTTKLIVGEPNAFVTVESDAGAAFPLSEQGNGVYAISYIPAGSATEKYRLNIKTAGGKQYLSDFVQFKKTPPIDSLSWEQKDDGVHIYVTTHDSSNNSRFYKWNITETWEYHSAWYSRYVYGSNGIHFRGPAEQVYACWRTIPQSNIYLQSTTNLAQDVAYKKELVFIPTADIKLSVKYSILVEQNVLTPDAFAYWNSLAKNTENLGTIFDPQPSQLATNIQCITDAKEPVIGFVSATSTTQERLFISWGQIKNWPVPTGMQVCDTVHLDRVDSYVYWLSVQYGDYLLIDQLPAPGGNTYYAAPIECSDCRQKGGTTVKPPFWP